jgi:arginine decarboxylase
LLDLDINSENLSGRFTHGLIDELHQEGISINTAESIKDCFDTIACSTNLSGVILTWDSFRRGTKEFEDFLTSIKSINPGLPIFVFTQSHELNDTSIAILKDNVNFFWKYGDTFDFVVGRIKNITIEYLSSLMPPFFKELSNYTSEYKYAWHTPGHMGGVAFLKSPVGRLFYDYYGENVFRGDLSISVPELGSLMDHSGVNGESERFAAKTFGADHSFFVTNGSSTSNKIIVMSCVGKDEVVIVDRNCHKSLQHALSMSNAIPIYFKPSRNAYGIIGTIPLLEFDKKSIISKIKASPLIKNKSTMPKMAIITNSTYDGLIYNVPTIKDALAKSHIMHLHFDEAWYPYAHFHPIYKDKYAMGEYHQKYHPTIYCTQSTHKLLAAFSQASMVHIKNGVKPLNVNLFNETYMMHTSTSPQYNIIASLDVATKMMEGPLGYRLVNESITEAIEFRQEFYKIRNNCRNSNEWFFNLWEPDDVQKIKSLDTHNYVELEEKDQSIWELNPKSKWHGFSDLSKRFTMLDPIKITILTPGINLDTTFQDVGIPAPIVAKFLIKDGVVDEKTSFYSMLFLFSIGVNKSNSINLLNALLLFKKAYDENTQLEEIFPKLMKRHADFYGKISLKDLCDKMHSFLKKADASMLLMKAFDILPEQTMTPNEAYQHIVQDNGTEYPLEEMHNKVALTMLAPYPPGIPILMPGEKITKKSKNIIDYLGMLERFDNEFPGFENEVHGVEVRLVRGKRKYFIYCL